MFRHIHSTLLVIIFSSYFANVTKAQDGPTTVLQAYLASLELLENCDVIVHIQTERKTTVGNKKPVDTYSQEHFRVIKSVDKEWAVKATIEILDGPTKVDIKQLRPSTNPSENISVQFFFNNVAASYLPGRANRPLVGSIKDFSTFDIQYLPSVELLSLPVAPRGPLDRHAYFDSQIENLGYFKNVRTVGDQIYFMLPQEGPVTTIFKMNKDTQIPTEMTLNRNKQYSGPTSHSELQQILKYEHKEIGGIKLPIKKTVSGSNVENVDGQTVKTSHSRTTTIQWLKVNEELEFPDVDKIGTDYPTLYEFIFQEKP
jgi:hypothetical protein